MDALIRWPSIFPKIESAPQKWCEQSVGKRLPKNIIEGHLLELEKWMLWSDDQVFPKIATAPEKRCEQSVGTQRLTFIHLDLF